MEKVLYVRVDPELHEWVKTLAEEAGISMNKMAAALLTEARKSGVKVQPVIHPIIRRRVRRDPDTEGLAAFKSGGGYVD